MKIQKNGYALPVGSDLIEILTKEIQASGKNGNGGLYINFRDPKYSPEAGGFHPVEVMVSGAGIIQYITDFAYVGYPPELVKELDFDFSMGIFQHMGREFPIGDNHSFFCLWQCNFCAYYSMGAFSVTVEAVL